MAVKLFVGKKGVFFTLMTVTFLLVFVMILLLPTYSQQSEKMVRVENRVLMMNDFVNDLERDMGRALYISMYRGILAIESSVINSGEFISDFEGVFEEVMLNGSINGEAYTIMNASTYPDWIAKIQEEGENFNLIVNVSLHNLDVGQIDAWNLLVEVNVTIEVEDTAGTAAWNITKEIVASVPVIGFEDPLYVVYSFGRTTNTIEKSNLVGNFTSNVSSLLEHISEGYYWENVDAPSFIMRFENNLSGSVFGIESMIDVSKLAGLGLDVNNGASVVDHQYWRDVNGGYRINDTSNWVRMDLGHVNDYGLNSIAYLE